MVASKEAYLEKLQAKIHEWNAEIDKLKAKTDGSKADLKLAIDKQVGGLENRRQEVEKKIQELRQAGESAWEDLKAGVQQAWDKLDEAVTSAKTHFS